MHKTVATALSGLLFAAPLLAQTPPSTLQLTVDQAVKMALDNNVDLATERLGPQISDTEVAAAFGAFKPVFSSSLQRNDQLEPPSNFLIPTATRTNVVTSEVALSQRLQRFGTSYSIAWDTSHTDSNSVLNSYNPLVRSGLALNISQPLFRGFRIDPARQQLSITRTNRAVADTRLRETLVQTTADVKRAYWNLVSARSTVGARMAALQLAEELARVNKAKVDVGQSPPLDLVAAQAEVAADQEQLIIAETDVKQREDRLRMLIFDPTQRSNWNVAIETVDAPPAGTVSIDLEAAVTNALASRTDIDRARKAVDLTTTTLAFTNNQRLPDVRLNGTYLASGLGGTQVLRTGGFPGTVIGGGSATGFGSVLGQLFSSDYPTWALGVSVAYPIGKSTEMATYAQAQLDQTQAQSRLKSTQGQAIQQVRNAAWNIEMNAKRMDTTRAAREFAEQRLDAEQKRFGVGISTSFLVIQAQRDLSQARANELAAVLGYDLALVDFEALQQAGPSGQGGSSASSATSQGAFSSQTSQGAATTTTQGAIF